MKFLLFFFCILFGGCASVKQSPPNLVTGTGMTIPFQEVFLHTSKISFRAPISTDISEVPGKWWRMFLNSGIETGARGEREFSFNAYIFEVGNDISVYDYLMTDNCDPRKQTLTHSKDRWRDVNQAYKYQNIRKILTSEATDVFLAENICNFPADFTHIPNESVFCTKNMIENPASKFDRLCQILSDMGKISPLNGKVTDMPTFFNNEEYIVRTGITVIRVRAYWSSVSEKGNDVLRQILMSTTSVSQ